MEMAFNILLTAVIIAAASIGLIKFFDCDDIPYKVASMIVFALIASSITIVVSLIAIVWS